MQRWERDLGLPVHRIKTPEAGSIIYALKSEVDAWRAHQGELAPSAGAATGAAEIDVPLDPATDSVATADNPKARGVRGWQTWLLAPIPAWTVLALLGVAVAAVFYARAVPPTGMPALWEFEGRDLRAYTEGGRPLWTHSFARAVSRPASMRGPGALADADADGENDLVVPVRFAPHQSRPLESDSVIAFDENGSIIWSIQPEIAFATSTETFEGPWHVRDIAAGMSAQGPRVWVAFSHHTWWPGFVLEVAPDGASRLKYVQPGRIYSLTYWETPAETWLVAGGTLNEASSASVALVDADGPPVLWQQEAGPALECEGCSDLLPAAMFLLPTSEVTEALSRPYEWVTGALVKPTGIQLVLDSSFGQGTLATLSTDLHIGSIARTDHYWQVHQDLERQNQIAHSARDCPDQAEPLIVRRWTREGGWSEESVTLRRPVIGDARKR